MSPLRGTLTSHELWSDGIATGKDKSIRRRSNSCLLVTSHHVPMLARRAMSSLTRTTAPLLVTPAEVKGAGPVFLDASWFMPGAPRKPREEWAAKRIPGARFFDLDAVASDHPLGLKHMLPSPAQFASECREPAVRCHLRRTA